MESTATDDAHAGRGKTDGCGQGVVKKENDRKLMMALTVAVTHLSLILQLSLDRTEPQNII